MSSASSSGGDTSYPSPSKLLRAKMTTNGHLLPDPQDKKRLTVWLTGGTTMPVKQAGEEDAEKPKKKKKKKRSKKAGTEVVDPSLSSVKETACQECTDLCPLLLHECRRDDKECPLHGQKKLSKAYRHKMKARVDKYVRPKSYGIFVPSKTGLSVGNMVDAPLSSEWEDIFAPESNWKNKSWGDIAKLLAAKMLLGADVPENMEDDGSMSYSLSRPVGGHGTSHVDVLYLDNDLRITKGNAGSLFVQVKDNPKKATNISDSTSSAKSQVHAPAGTRTSKAMAARLKPTRQCTWFSCRILIVKMLLIIFYEVVDADSLNDEIDRFGDEERNSINTTVVM